MTDIANGSDGARERLRKDAPRLYYLTVLEVAALARCEHKRVRRAIASGQLVAFRPAGKLLVREDDARAWIERHPVHATRPNDPRPASRAGAGRRGRAQAMSPTCGKWSAASPEPGAMIAPTRNEGPARARGAPGLGTGGKAPMQHVIHSTATR